MFSFCVSVLCSQVGTNTGSIHYIDCRTDAALWELSAHTKEVTGTEYIVKILLTMSYQDKVFILTPLSGFLGPTSVYGSLALEDGVFA
jgi:hypothetical protein